MKENKLIEELIIDKPFGIYTRNGFEYVLSQQNKYHQMNVILVDFNNVKHMNQSMGYHEVNDLFKTVFNELKDIFIIGRAFSGDEIFFYTDNFLYDISYIIKVCKRYDLELDSISQTFYSFETSNLTEFLDNMTNLLHKKQVGE